MAKNQTEQTEVAREGQTAGLSDDELQRALLAREAEWKRRRAAVLRGMLDNGVDVRAQVTAPGLLIVVAPEFVEMTEEGRRRAEVMLGETS